MKHHFEQSEDERNSEVGQLKQNLTGLPGKSGWITYEREVFTEKS